MCIFVCIYTQHSYCSFTSFRSLLALGCTRHHSPFHSLQSKPTIPKPIAAQRSEVLIRYKGWFYKSYVGQEMANPMKCDIDLVLGGAAGDTTGI